MMLFLLRIKKKITNNILQYLTNYSLNSNFVNSSYYIIFIKKEFNHMLLAPLVDPGCVTRGARDHFQLVGVEPLNPIWKIVKIKKKKNTVEEEKNLLRCFCPICQR